MTVMANGVGAPQLCHTCGEAGHIRRNCPQNKPPAAAAPMAVDCPAAAGGADATTEKEQSALNANKVKMDCPGPGWSNPFQ